LPRRSPRGARGPAGARNGRSGPQRSGSYAEPPVQPLQLRTHALAGEKSLRPGRYSCPAWRGPACQIRARSFRHLSLRVTQLHQLVGAAQRAGAAAPVDQPGSCESHRHRPALISTPDTSGPGHAMLAPPVSVPALLAHCQPRTNPWFCCTPIGSAALPCMRRRGPVPSCVVPVRRITTIR
jgi:hypothetical protein